MSFLDKIPMQTLVIATIFLGLSPFVPEPHLWQKLKMLVAGDLVKPLDIFDMFFHAAPGLLLMAKLARNRASAGEE
ncbi:RND transporter [Profundibacter sp.]